MKFAHISDIHLGGTQESGRRWGKDRTEEVYDALARALASIGQRGASLVLITGGLFAHCPITVELDRVNRLFASFPAMKFIITAGGTDALRRSSPVLSFRWAENVHYVLSGKGEKICLNGIPAVVYAASETEDDISVENLRACAENDAERKGAAIAAAYEPSPEKASALADSCFSYVALGGTAAKFPVVPEKVYYCGALEAGCMTDTGEHGYLFGEIQDATGTLLSVEFVPFSSVSYVPLRIRVSQDMTPAELEQLTAEEIEKRGPANIYRIHVIGEKRPGSQFGLAMLRQKYRIAEVADDSVPKYDFESLYAEHTQDMIGYYISQLTRKSAEMSDIDRQALFLGIDALLRSAETKVTEEEG